MIRIAVMDDREEDRQRLCRTLEQYMQKKKEECNLIPYESPTDLLTDPDIRKSLETVLRELNSTDFVKIGRGTAVNVRYIRLTEGEKVVLSNGECLQMNRYDSSNIKKRILECLTAKQ